MIDMNRHPYEFVNPMITDGLVLTYTYDAVSPRLNVYDTSKRSQMEITN